MYRTLFGLYLGLYLAVLVQGVAWGATTYYASPTASAGNTCAGAVNPTTPIRGANAGASCLAISGGTPCTCGPLINNPPLGCAQCTLHGQPSLQPASGAGATCSPEPCSLDCNIATAASSGDDSQA